MFIPHCPYYLHFLHVTASLPLCEPARALFSCPTEPLAVALFALAHAARLWRHRELAAEFAYDAVGGVQQQQQGGQQQSSQVRILPERKRRVNRNAQQSPIIGIYNSGQVSAMILLLSPHISKCENSVLSTYML